MSNRKLYRKIAKKNKVSVAAVKQDMQSAINHAHGTARNSDATKSTQNSVPRKGAVPTVDEVLTYAQSKLKKRFSANPKLTILSHLL